MPEPTSSPDRHLRALADTVGDSRPRTPEDGSDPSIPVAATVVIVRDGDDGPEVLLIERPDRGSFAGAWVFPGGKVDPEDRVDGETEHADAARAAVRETWEETGLVVELHDLVTVSWWDPPPGIELRIRTWFFAVSAPAGDIVLSEAEAVTAQWVRPADALDQHERSALPLYPPTWVTLHSLAGFADAAALLAAARERGIGRFETSARRGAEGPMLVWAGDADYDGDGRGEASARHRLAIGGLPWVYTRTV